MKKDAPRGFSIRIFLPEGDPDGLKIVEKSNWTGCGLVFPRSLYKTVRKRNELRRTGVYLLIGPAESSGMPQLYIGEGDPILPRLDQHAAKKDFWTTGVAFTSKDANLNKAHVQHLEARLLQLAAEAKRCELDNANAPQLPSLSEADTAEVDGFIDEMLLCFPVLGVGFFEKAEPASIPIRELLLSGRGIKARGYEAPQGFVVRAGSHAVASEVPSIHAYMTAIRKTLMENGVLRRDDTGYVLTQDYAFASPSTAAGVLLGRTANGRIEWKTADGQTLKSFQEAEASGS